MNKPSNPAQAAEFLELYRNNTNKELAKKLDVHPRTVRKWRKHAESIYHNIQPGQKLKGVSVYEDFTDPLTGEKKKRWVKTDAELDETKAILEEFAEALKEEIPRQKPTDKPEQVLSDLLSCYVVTDLHFGQLSWGEETGNDYDLSIAEELLVNWFRAAIKSAPDSQTAVLAELGDLMHSDGLQALTPASGHLLDADSRYAKVVRVVIRVMRQIINLLLEKHENVHVIFADGNHNESGSVWMRELFAEKYAEEPRVTVENSPSVYYAYKWGNTALFFHHGHKKNIKNVSKVFAGQFREIYGTSKYSYGHVGHLHHRDVKEDSLMVVEQHSTLAAKDAYSSRGGYLSERGASVITYSKKHGEVSRNTIRPEMVL